MFVLILKCLRLYFSHFNIYFKSLRQLLNQICDQVIQNKIVNDAIKVIRNNNHKQNLFDFIFSSRWDTYKILLCRF